MDSGMHASRSPRSSRRGNAELSRLDSLQTRYHRIQQREEHLSNGVAIVALRQTKLSRKRILESWTGIDARGTHRRSE